ncbi:MAG: shikimate dehydrogenase [Thiolinea sp.]
MTQADQYAVIGNPVTHSKSPFIHAAFARQTSQNLQYTAIEVAIGAFAEQVALFRQQGMKGCNVTTPFKEDAWEVADVRSPAAQQAGAVNTLAFRADGSIFGDNTDGSGLVNDLQTNWQLPLRDKRILILGAGGAVRGILQPLLAAQPEAIYIANRTAEKAINLAALFTKFGQISGGGFADIEQSYDLIINGTAASLQGEMPVLPVNCLKSSGACYDLMYATEPTVFLRWAEEQGADVLADGLGMLVEQAADAFAVWRGIRPDTKDVLTELRQLMLAG